MKTIGFLGPEGTFSEEALRLYLKNTNTPAKPKAIVPLFNLFTALDERKCDEIIVPIENSIGGAVSQSLDFMVQFENIYMTAEIVVPIHLHLMSHQDSELSQITDIFSHPQPLAQCAGFLIRNCPNARLHDAVSTVAAIETAKATARKDEHVSAVIGHNHLADRFNLSTLAEDIQDYSNNVTRFGLLSHTDTQPTGQDKTSIAFSSRHDKPGSLYEILGVFAQHNINLTKIVSEPMKSKLGEYLFFIDFEGHEKDPDIRNVLKSIQEKSLFYKLLGAYHKQQ